MKKFILASILLITIASFSSFVQAQHVSVNINIGRQPSWGPVGYDYVDYYYFPDINCYYDVNINRFYYFDRGRWISARYLPYAYSEYDLYNLYKVVLNVRDPWMYNRVHYRDYAQYRGYRHQPMIRDSRDNRYRDSRHNNVVWYNKNNSGHHYDKNQRPNQSYNNGTRPNHSNNYNDRYNNKNENNSHKYNKNDRSDNHRNNGGYTNQSDRNKGNDNRFTQNREKENNRGRDAQITRSSSTSDRNTSGRDERNGRGRR